jgi:hypothetical protein
MKRISKKEIILNRVSEHDERNDGNHPKDDEIVDGVHICQQGLSPHLELDGSLLDLIVPEATGERAGWHRPKLTLLLDSDTGEVVRRKISKAGVTVQ